MAHLRYKILFILLLLLGIALKSAGYRSALPLYAQDVQDGSENLVLIEANADRLPKIQLVMTGVGAGGRRLNFDQTPLVVSHGGEEINGVEVVEEVEVGTFTIFLVDTPFGVQESIPAIKEAINRFADPAYMKEPVDHVAVYQVDARSAELLLETTPFHNTIRNFLVDDLPTPADSTALFDSLSSLIDELPEILPRPDMSASIVVVSDGTDAVSVGIDQAGLIEKVASSGIQVHSIHLDNVLITDPQLGTGFLQSLANVSGGVSTGLNEEGVLNVWDVISTYRSHVVVEYQPSDLTSRDVPILVGLANNRDVEVGTSLFIPPGAMLVDIEIGPDQRSFTVPDITTPVTIRVPVKVSWLDGSNESNEVTSLQLMAGDQILADVDNFPAGATEWVEVTLTGLRYGDYPIRALANDSRGVRVESSPINLNISAGETLVIPDRLATASAGVGRWTWWVGCGSVLLLGLVLAVFFGRTRGRGDGRSTPAQAPAGLFSSIQQRFSAATKPRRARTAPSVLTESNAGRDYASSSGEAEAPRPPRPVTSQPRAAEPVAAQQAERYGNDPLSESGQRVAFWFEVLESAATEFTNLPLVKAEHRLGRSPNQADITFPQEPTISRLHALVAREANAYRLFDQQSTSGTYVNDRVVPDYGTLLRDGDEIRMGEVLLRYHCLF